MEEDETGTDKKEKEIPNVESEDIQFGIPKSEINFINKMLDRMIEEAFAEFWNVVEDNSKLTPKKEIAREAFMAGIGFTFHFMQQMNEKDRELEEEEIHGEGS